MQAAITHACCTPRSAGLQMMACSSTRMSSAQNVHLPFVHLLVLQIKVDTVQQTGRKSQISRYMCGVKQYALSYSLRLRPIHPPPPQLSCKIMGSGNTRRSAPLTLPTPLRWTIYSWCRIRDRLLTIMTTDRPANDKASGYLGILAWRYILTDFYNIQYGSADDRSVSSILRAILSRYHLLVTAKVGFFQTKT